MMRRFLLAVTLPIAWTGAARADWHARVEAIMGTRIAVEVISTALNDAELERKLARIRMFRFEGKDAEAMTTTKPIEFFPA